jgi:glucose/arabinose dehydrogenase
MRLRVALALAALACGGSAGSAAPAPPPPPPAAGSACLLVDPGPGPAGAAALVVETVASGLEVPWGIAFLPGGDLLVTERPGRIRIVRGGALAPAPVATVAVEEIGEGGLLGIALAPDFPASRRFFVHYTAPGGRENRIAAWILAADGASAREERVLVGGIPAAIVHDGGRLRLGPDGKLWASTGDARRPEEAQDPASLAGKLLRLEPDGSSAAGNPVPGSPVWALGLRNVQGFDWLDDGRLAIADHGPSGEVNGWTGHDEVTVAGPGANLGWPLVHGCDARDGAATPSIAWVRALPPGGVAVFRGGAIPGWHGSVVVGALGARHLQRLVLDGARVVRHEVHLAGDPPGGLGRVREVVQGPDGALWATTSNCDGRGTCGPEKDRVVRITGR